MAATVDVLQNELTAQINNSTTNITSTEFLENQSYVNNLAGNVELGRSVLCGIKIGSQQMYNLFEILNQRIDPGSY